MRIRLLFILVLFAAGQALSQRASTPPLSPVHPHARQTYTAIMMWHDVVKDKKEVWFDVTEAEFRSQMEQLRRRKFNVITLDALYRHLTEGAPVPPRPVVLTFDDNTKGLYDYAYPILKEFNYPATFFVHTDYVGVRTVKDHCDWNELREMQKSGLISVQSHTRTHPPDLRKLPDTRLRRELLESKQIIERQMGKPVFAFAYTEGNYDARVVRMVAEAGYRMAIAEDWGSAGASPNLLEVRRYSIHKRFSQCLRDVERAWRKRQER
jgi:peptidoglycan/xylan/chitin deacetylase (PgdA/CDA1 family)